MAETTTVPWYYYPEVLERFRKDTAEHAMVVMRDNGLYRHVRFQRPSEHRWMYWYELITTPGQLTIRGDMGTYVFARIDDMFDFFGGPYINAGYWGEKLEAHSGYRQYSEDVARKRVVEYFDQSKDGYTNPDEIRAAIDDEILAEDVIPFEDMTRDALSSFKHSGFEFWDVWEWDLHDYTYQFLWCCHAIQQGIRRYRAEAAS